MINPYPTSNGGNIPSYTGVFNIVPGSLPMIDLEPIANLSPPSEVGKMPPVDKTQKVEIQKITPQFFFAVS